MALNTVTENQPYLLNWKPCNVQIWYTDGVWWPALPTCMVTFKLKALGGCSSHHLQGAGAYCVGQTACLVF